MQRTSEMDVLIFAGLLLIIFVVCKVTEYYFRSLYVQDTKNKCVLITGCDTGFGHLLALQLDKRGVRVFAGCFTEKGETKLAEKCSSNAVTFRLDVTKEDSIQNAVNLVKSKLGPQEELWGLVNNAGVLQIAAPLEWQNKEDFDKTIGVNLYGTAFMTKGFLPLLRQSRGRVVNMSSIVTLVAMPGIVSYNVSKAAVESYTDTLRREIYNMGVTAHLIQPSGFATNVFPLDANDRLRMAYQKLPENVRDYYGEKSLNIGGNRQVKAHVSLDKDLSKVTNAISHALFAKYPKYRYPVGPGAVALFWTLNHVPEFIVDRIFAMPAPEK